MVLNFSTTEYHILCKVADFHGTMPAQWCHDQIMHKAYSEWKVIKEWESEGGKEGGGTQYPSPQSPPPPNPIP